MEEFCAWNSSPETTVRFLVVGINGSASKPFTNVKKLWDADLYVLPYVADLLTAGLSKHNKPDKKCIGDSQQLVYLHARVVDKGRIGCPCNTIHVVR